MNKRITLLTVYNNPFNKIIMKSKLFVFTAFFLAYGFTTGTEKSTGTAQAAIFTVGEPQVVITSQQFEELDLGFDAGLYALHVKDFGALPDDSICDIIAIRAAINHAKEINAARLEFDAGVYNLDQDAFHAQGETGDLITIIGVSGLILEGKSGTAGEPLTRFERNIRMRNNPDLGRVLSIRSSADIHLKNIIISNNPQFTSAGEVVLVDRANDIVVVDAFEGLPHFDGMWCASANAWDLTTRRRHVLAFFSSSKRWTDERS